MVITGIIRPPPDIRAVAEKTASYVAVKGRAFEARILNSAKGKTPQFAFLHESSPFHAYYEDRIRFYEEGGTESKDLNEKEVGACASTLDKNKKEGTSSKEEERSCINVDGPKQKTKAQNLISSTSKAIEVSAKLENGTTAFFKASAVDPVARVLLTQRKKIASIHEAARASEKKKDSDDVENKKIGENGSQVSKNYFDKISEKNYASTTEVQPPPPLHFVDIAAPANYSPLQLDVMKLVAQFTALQSVHNQRINSKIIQSNPSVRQDASFLRQLAHREWHNPSLGFIQPRHASFAYFTALVDSYKRILKPRNKKSFTNDWFLDLNNLPTERAQCLDLAAYRAEFERDMSDRKQRELQDSDGQTLGGAAIIDWHDFVVVETIDFPTNEVVDTKVHPKLPPSSSLSVSVPPPVKKKMQDDDDMEQSSDEEDDDASDANDNDIRIDPTYKPRIVSSKSAMHDPSRLYGLDPISGKSVPISDISEHLRIQLLDPKWAEEKKKFMDKQRDSNYVMEGVDIARNISNFVGKKRGDNDDVKDSKGDLLKKSPVAGDGQRAQDETPIVTHMQETISYSSLSNPVVSNQSSTNNLTMSSNVSSASSSLSLLPPMTQPMGIQGGAIQNYFSAPIQQGLPYSMPQQMQTYSMVQGVHDEESPVRKKAKTIELLPENGEDVDVTTDKQSVEASSTELKHLNVLPTTVTVTLRIPSSLNTNINPAWNLNGQTIHLNSISHSTTVKDLKVQLSNELGGEMPINKMQIKDEISGIFLRDAIMLKDCGLRVTKIDNNDQPEGEGNNVVLDLVPKVRGGRK